MEEEIYKVYKHNPPHLFRPNGKYFITGAIYKKAKLLKVSDSKEKFINSLLKACDNFDWTLEDWVILDNHYHIMLSAPEDASDLSKLIQEVHKFVALWIRKNIKESSEFQRIFQNYWDTCITNERSYCARLNYIYFNPVKHGYVDFPDKYEFCSYIYRLKIEKSILEELRNKYPWEGITIEDDF